MSSTPKPLWPTGGELHTVYDPETQLHAIIAIHSTKRGPALGGCRFLEYDAFDDALFDVVRLATAMTYKAVMADLPLGGGKSVILRPKNYNREHLFQRFGKFIDQLGGRYITALDSGSTIDDMANISVHTKHNSSKPSDGDPSPFTAEGTFQGIKAAVRDRLSSDSLKDLRVAIQGVGHVGLYLAEKLHDAGAKLIVSDIDESRVNHCVQSLGATAAEGDAILSAECDILAPCALGGIIHTDNVAALQTPIIAGAANNQLLDEATAHALHARNILYAPDYVINGGGLIHCVASYFDWSDAQKNDKITKISNTLSEIFEASRRTNKPTAIQSDDLAKARLADAA